MDHGGTGTGGRRSPLLLSEAGIMPHPLPPGPITGGNEGYQGYCGWNVINELCSTYTRWGSLWYVMKGAASQATPSGGSFSPPPWSTKNLPRVHGRKEPTTDMRGEIWRKRRCTPNIISYLPPLRYIILLYNISLASAWDDLVTDFVHFFIYCPAVSHRGRSREEGGGFLAIIPTSVSSREREESVDTGIVWIKSIIRFCKEGMTKINILNVTRLTSRHMLCFLNQSKFQTLIEDFHWLFLMNVKLKP